MTFFFAIEVDPEGSFAQQSDIVVHFWFNNAEFTFSNACPMFWRANNNIFQCALYDDELAPDSDFCVVGVGKLRRNGFIGEYRCPALFDEASR